MTWTVKPVAVSGPEPTARRPLGELLRDLARENRRLLIAIGIAELVAVLMVSTISPHDHIDGEVYRLGARAWLQGQDMYGPLPATESGLRLPFIYPPFAAVLFSPLGLIPKVGAVAVIMLVSHLALLITLYLVLDSASFLRGQRDRVVLWTGVLLPLATLSEPVMETLTYAQINLVLMALVAIDCLWRTGPGERTPYPRGLLIGIAAGIKLTPAAFLLFFLLRKEFRPIAMALAGFLGTVLIGAVLAFDGTRRYWLHEVMATGNVSFGPNFTGNASVYAGNQSLRSVLTKLGVGPVSVLFVLVVLLALALAVAGMVHALRQQDLPMAVTLNGLLSLLISPISWSHHWVWAIPALVLLAGAAVRRQDWGLLMITGLAASFFTLGPMWKVPQGKGRELRWNLLEHFVGNAYVYFGLALLAYYAYGWWRSRRLAARSAEQDEPPAVSTPA
ncbi:glycosyltransferase 87 family protein [Saccharopolyspora sp. MS10]|uniref:glycosyltransferase 87 family protein n=1 Tax=Saccharopolyspora sp. MS10 TaxID=3385973 RepID=UPI00399F8357